MTHTAENMKNRASLKMEFGMVHRIELPRGLAEGENREWLENFIKYTLIEGGAVKNYEIVSSGDNLRKFLSINVRSHKNEADFDVESSTSSMINATPEKLEVEPTIKKNRLSNIFWSKKPYAQKKLSEKIFRRVLVYFIFSPFFILNYLTSREKVGRVVSTITQIMLGDMIINFGIKTWIFFGGNYADLPGLVKLLAW